MSPNWKEVVKKQLGPYMKYNKKPTQYLLELRVCLYFVTTLSIAFCLVENNLDYTIKYSDL